MNTTLLLQSRHATGKARVTAARAARVVEMGIGLRKAERLSNPLKVNWSVQRGAQKHKAKRGH